MIVTLFSILISLGMADCGKDLDMIRSINLPSMSMGPWKMFYINQVGTIGEKSGCGYVKEAAVLDLNESLSGMMPSCRIAASNNIRVVAVSGGDVLKYGSIQLLEAALTDRSPICNAMVKSNIGENIREIKKTLKD